jgi:Leucine-rich repeat (LRR) protein
MSATELFFNLVRQLDTRDGPEKLTKADIYGANIGDAGSVRLAASLNRNFELRVLNVGSNCVGNEGAAAIATALQSNSTLQTLHLHENSIGNDAVFHFGRILMWSNASLRVLDLSSNAIDDKGAIALVRIFKTPSNLEGNSSLTELYLSNNQIGNAAAIEMSKMLLENVSLMHLDLSHCRISDVGGLSFVQAVIANTQLHTLNLSFNGLSHKLGDEFIVSLTRRSQMLRLFVQGQGIPHDILTRISALGPQPPPSPTKWVRPAPQGVLEALTSRMTQDNKISNLQARLKAVRAFTKSGSGNRSEQSISAVKAADITTPDLKEEHGTHLANPSEFQPLKANRGKVLSKSKTVSCSKKMASKIRSDTCNTEIQTSVHTDSAKIADANLEHVITDSNHPPCSETFQSETETALKIAQILASVIVADARAIATDIILEAQKHLARALAASKSKPLISTELDDSKHKQTHSLLDRSAMTYTGDLGDLYTSIKVSAPFVPNFAAVPVLKPVDSSALLSAPLGFQKFHFINEVATVPVRSALTDFQGIDSANIETTQEEPIFQLSLDLKSETDADEESDFPSSKADWPLKSSSVQLELLRPFLGLMNTSYSDSLPHEPVTFTPLTNLPILEMEDLSELFHTDDATSIIHCETTGPQWFVKMRTFEGVELEGLPEHIAVKQFYDELSPIFHREFTLFNAIQGQYCVAITHVLTSAGASVGLVMEHLPLLLDDAMYGFSLFDAVCVLVKCGAALISLHMSNVAHSNISTHSFILSSDYRVVKLAEFAIDQCILSSNGFMHKQEAMFAAPEMMNQDNVASTLSDIYAFGALIWQILHPLSMMPQSSSPLAASLAAARGSLPVFSRVGIPSCISGICHRCMSLDPSVRPQSMIEVIDALNAAKSMISPVA